MKRHSRVVLVYILVAAGLYFVGAAWNTWLWPLNGFYGDIIPWGRYSWSIGDFCLLMSFALALSLPFRYSDMR